MGQSGILKKAVFDILEQVSEEKIRKAMEYGNASGSICCSYKGAIASLPSRTEIEKLIAEKVQA